MDSPWPLYCYIVHVICQHANGLECIKIEVLACMHVNLISYRNQIDKYTETS